jgi:hypothetical protein
MGLTIALIVFSIVLLTIFIGIYLWWRKYGVKLFNMFINTQNMGKNTPNLPNFGDQMKIFNDLMSKNFKNNRKNPFL